ncbi:MAG: alpha/beta-hydrolase family protein [Acidimicrobiia bacterium]
MRAKNTATLAGVISGVRFAAKSFEPSLMKRSAIDQGLITGGTFLTGFLAGALTGRAITVLPIPAPSSAVTAVGVAAATARSAELLNSNGTPALPPVDESEAWSEAGAELLSAVALAGVGSHDKPPITGVASGTAVVVSTALETKSALDRRPDNPDPKYVATAIGVAAGLNAAVAAIGGVVALGWKIPKWTMKPGPLRSLTSVVGIGGAAFGLFAAGNYGISTLLGKIAAGNRKTEIAYSSPPDSNSVSGGQFSIAGYDTLGVQGRRLVSEVTPVDDIESVMGEKATHEPIRVYVGLGSAESEDERIELAIQELRRTGAFDRSLLIVASPAGTGYVNYIAVEAAELMARGDVATVAVQYGEVPSMLSITKVGDAARVYAKLLDRIRAEIGSTGKKPRIAAYGESLGAITCQMGVQQASEGFEGLAVDDALWVGTPQGSALFAELTEAGMPVFDQFDEVRAYLAEGNEVPDVFFLNHANDPVTKMNPKIFYESPDWLKSTDRGRNVEPNQRWLPGVSFWQTLIDTKNAATVIPGEFFSTGHDYRADLAEFIKAAYHFDDVDDTQMAAIEARLRASEVTRAEAIAEGKVDDAQASEV